MSITEKSPKSIELDNVGPIEHLTIPIPDGGGVVVLRGQNGSGKSHALAGVESLYNGTTRKTLRNSDGVPSGKIDGLGVTVRLGRSNTARGELVCESLGGHDPSKLVDPGLKDPMAADRRRLETLIRLAGIKVTGKEWAELIGESADLIAIEALVDDDPVESADRIRRRLHESALAKERIAASKSTESATLDKSIADVDLTAPHNQVVLDANLDEATTALARAEAKRDEDATANERYLQAVRQVRETQAAEIDLQSAIESVGAVNKKLAEWESDLKSAKVELENAKERHNRCIAEGNRLNALKESAADRLRFAKKQADSLLEWQKIVESGHRTPITEKELTELQLAKASARQALQVGDTVRRAIATRQRSAVLANESDQIGKQAEHLRTLARSTDSVLEQALINAGFDLIKVHDGRLCVETDRGREPFSELSHGERWRIALDLVARFLPAGSVLPVCQEAWESLDPDNRAYVCQLAKERKIIIFTAEATSGDLRAEVMP